MPWCACGFQRTSLFFFPSAHAGPRDPAQALKLGGRLFGRAVPPALAFLSVWVSNEKRNEHLQPLELRVSVFVALTGPWI